MGGFVPLVDPNDRSRHSPRFLFFSTDEVSLTIVPNNKKAPPVTFAS